MANNDERGGGAGVAFLEQQSMSDSSTRSSKAVQIQNACEQKDFQLLVQLADSPGGLLEDHFRRLAWPILLACPTASNDDDSSWRQLPRHKDEEQVQRDVDRAFVHYPNNESEKTTQARKRALFDLIVRTLRSHPMLCYFQGFHDIAQVVMLVLGPDDAYLSIEAISLLRIRDYMLPSLAPALKHLRLLPAILQSADRELAGHVSLPHVHYALPAALTLYAHDIEQYSDIARLFDFILAHEPVMSIYLFAAIIMSRRETLLEIPAEDHDMLFFTLQKLPQPVDLEPLIADALRVFAEHPPDRLPSRVWRGISSSSALKTARSAERCCTLTEAEKHFQKQAEEVKWEEARQRAMQTAFRYRRPIATTAAAVAIGAISIWLRRSGQDRYVLSIIFSLLGVGQQGHG